MNAITARMGLDLNGLNQDFAKAAEAASRGARDMQQKFNEGAMKSAFASRTVEAGKGGKEGHGGHGGGMGGARMLGDTLDAVTGEKGWVMKMTMLSHSLPIAAMAGGVIAVEKMTEALAKMSEAAKGAKAELAKPMANTIAQGPEAVKKSMESIDEAKAKLQETRTFMGTMGDMLLNPLKDAGNKLSGRHLFDTNGNEESLKLEQQLEDRKFEMSAKFSATLKTQTAERTAALHVGQHELAISEAIRESKEKIAKIQADTTLLPDARLALIRQAKQEGEDKLEAAHASQAAYTVSIAAEEEITAVRKAGADVEIKTLEARAAAERELAHLAQSAEERRAHDNTAEGLEIQLDSARKATAEKKAQFAIDREVATLRGDSDEKEAMRLDREAADLERSRRGAKTEELPAIDAAIAKNAEAQRSFVAAKLIRDAHTEDTLLDANTGEGQGEHIQALAAKIGAAKKAQVGLDNSPDASPQQRADAAKKVHDLEQALKEAVRSQSEFTSGVKETNDELAAQLDHHDQIAQALRTQFEFHRKIEEAERNGNTAGAADLRIQESKTLQLQLQSAQIQAGDRNKATLSELAANAHNQAGAQAREAQRLEARANKQRMQGHVEEADRLQRDADKIKSGDKAAAQKKQDEANKYWAKPGRANQDHARTLQDQADKLRKGIAPLKDSDKQTALLTEQLAELRKIAGSVDGLGRVR